MPSKILTPLVALSLLAGSSAAVAQAAPPATASSRAGAAPGQEQLVGTTAWILAAIALGLIVWGIIELTDDEDDFPTSP